MKSMTGYGRGRAPAGGGQVVVEISALNHRQLDLRLDLPQGLPELERELRALVRGKVTRGSVSLRLSMTGAACQAPALDKTRAEQVLTQCRKLARQMHLKDDLTASHILSIPELWTSTPPDAALAVIQDPARRAVRLALSALDRMRRAEGAHLAEDLRRRLRLLESHVQHIERRAPRAARCLRRQLLARIKELQLPSRPDPVRIEREIAACITRGDISEELVRLRSHCRQFAQMTGSGRPAGRAMDFLIQEMLREVNTIGSKAGDTEIVRRVVALKAELERIREQVQNVE